MVLHAHVPHFSNFIHKVIDFSLFGSIIASQKQIMWMLEIKMAAAGSSPTWLARKEQVSSTLTSTGTNSLNLVISNRNRGISTMFI
jgi:hypothetical protein